MKRIKLCVKGTSPLLIHAFGASFGQSSKVQKKKTDELTPREQAEAHVYADKNGLLWCPTSWLKSAACSIASDYKVPGSRKSLKSTIGGALVFPNEKMYFKKKIYIKDIEIDSRPVAIQRASSKIMRHRARIELPWEIMTELIVIEDLLPPRDAHVLLNDAGIRAGIGDYRPNCFGSFGMFQISKWTVSR